MPTTVTEEPITTSKEPTTIEGMFIQNINQMKQWLNVLWCESEMSHLSGYFLRITFLFRFYKINFKTSWLNILTKNNVEI